MKKAHPAEKDVFRKIEICQYFLIPIVTFIFIFVFFYNVHMIQICKTYKHLFFKNLHWCIGQYWSSILLFLSLWSGGSADWTQWLLFVWKLYLLRCCGSAGVHHFRSCTATHGILYTSVLTFIDFLIAELLHCLFFRLESNLRTIK